MSSLAVKLWPQVAGPLIDFLLQGVTICQFATWLGRSRRRETRLVQATAVWLFLLGLVTSGLAAARAGHIFVDSFGNISGLYDGVWAQWQIVLLMLIHIPTEVFYAERALRLCTHRRVVMVILAILILAVAASAIAVVAVFPVRLGAWNKLQIDMFITSATLIAGTDLLITSIIIHGLWKRRDRTGNGRNRRLVRRLAIASAEAQIPPSLLALIICIMDAAGGVSLSQMAVAAMPKASIICFFMVLNTRTALRTEFTTSMPAGIPPRDPDVDLDMKNDVESLGHAAELPVAYYGDRPAHGRGGSTPSLDRCTTAESRQICTLQEVLSDPGSQIPEDELQTPPPTPSLRKEQLQDEEL